MMQNRQFYKRYNTQSDKKGLRQRLQESVEEINNDEEYSVNNTFLHSQNNRNFIQTTEDYFIEDTSSQGNDIFAQQINLSQEIKSRYMTCYNNNQDDMFPNEQCLSFKVKNLMKGLKELIKELCLTKNSNNQVQEELEKIIVEFQDSSKPSSNKYFERSNNARQLSCLSQIRVRTVHQIQEPSFNTLTDNDPYSQGLKLFHPFLSGTSFQSEQTQIQTRLNSFQQQLLSEYLQKYLSLLQKQINRISRYNGQKKLKYLLSTVMKQIFTQIMRFTYETKISIAKKQTNNLLNNYELKVNLLVSTLQRISKTNQSLYESFNMIRKSIKRQQKADLKLINKFEQKINYLDNLLRFRNRTDIREKFMKWRKNAIVIKQTQRVFVMNGIRSMVKEILYQFALNEGNLERWRFIVWGRMNVFIKSICNVGECVLFPVDEELLRSSSEESVLKSSVITENHRHYQSRISSAYNNRKNTRYNIQSSSLSQQSSPSPQTNSPDNDTFRFSQCQSPNRQQYDQNYLNQKKLLDQVHQTFSLAEIKGCLKHGQIIMHDVDLLFKLILIPVKNVGGIVVVKYQLNNLMSGSNKIIKNKRPIQTQTKEDKPQSFMNISSFYNILNAIQLSSSVIMELMTLKQKFQYFSSRIEQKSHHKLILNHLLSSQTQKITHCFSQTKKDLSKDLSKHGQKVDNEAKISQFVSIEEDNQQKESEYNENRKQLQISYQEADNLLTKMSVKKVFMYHKKDNSYSTCLKYTVNYSQSEEEGQQNSTIIGKDIVQAIFTQLQKINKLVMSDTDSNPSKCLYLKKSAISFYACPLIKNHQLIGFVEIHLDKDFSLQSKTFSSNNNINSQNSFIVKTVDSKSDILNQTIVFVTEVVVPMIMNLKVGQKQDMNLRKQKQKQNKCGICHESMNHNKKLKFYPHQHQQLPRQKTNENLLTLTDINKLFIKATSASDTFQQRLYQIEKIFHHEIEKHHNSFNSSCQNPQQEIALINQQLFTKIFYLNTPRTKDNKMFVIKKQKSQNISQDTFYHTNFDSFSQKSIKLPFIDMLKLFNYKTNMEEFQQQTIQIGVSKLNEIYKSILRKMKASQSNSLGQSEEKQNYLESFVQQLLKSTLIKSEVLPLENDKKYHALELWLYQLQHINKRYGKDKFYFKVSVYPVFSILDSKNKYLSAILCSAGIIVNNQAVSQRKNNLRNSSLKSMNQFSFKLSQQFLGRIIQVEIKNQSVSKKDITKNINTKPSIAQSKHQVKQINIDLRRLTNLQETKLNIYNKNQPEIHKIISSIIHLQNQIKISTKIKAKKVILQKFQLSFKYKKYETLKKLTEIIEKKIVNKNLTTKNNMFLMFMKKLTQQNIKKSQKYMINSIEFVQKMSNIFIRNKMLKTSIMKLKNLTYENSSQVVNKLFQPGLKITKKFALQRIQKTISQKIYGKNSQSKGINDAFEMFKNFSNFKGDISSYEKQISIVKLSSALQMLICAKTYLPYFTNLSKLQKSLYQSISLVGTEIQTINFYSIHQFLAFINERISIIINSEKRLIQILYGKFIQKVSVQIIIQNQQTQKIGTLSTTDSDDNQIVFEQIKPNFEYSPIFMVQNDRKKFYISLQLTQNQTSQDLAFKDLRKFIENIFQNHVSSVFKKFMKLYAKKMDAFVLKLSKFMKIPAHQVKNNIVSKQNEELNLKRQSFSRFMDNLFKQQRSVKIEYLACQVQMKSKQLAKLHDFHEKRMRKLTTSEIIPDKIQINMSEFINEGLFQNIVSKKSLKQLKKSIQNLDMNSENLSIHYQIKSKTVAGHQMLDIINKRERKQAMKEVLTNLSTIINEESATNLCSTNTFFLSSMRKQMIWSATSRNLPQPNVEDVIMQEKQKLNYQKASHQQQKDLYDQKFKKTSIKSITKVLKNVCQSTFSKTFYRINSYSWVNSPKLIR